ncbi:MAG: YIP1 family protein [Clostridiales bacterium]|nr:YIP1 family protein [Clostridiales bacterium]MCC8136734.1 YIP1 family protein [Clostridiales bacterium]MCD7745447.1 YIP1 family protein [Lachnospiraceae bacterium]MCD7762539.1 YIP1 family protein [Lachnospiraceae bacterium]MCD7765437.1 YIP1 family protein [Lachnospiraceae bacterium]
MNSLFSKEKWKYAFYTVSHPMDAYYEIRHRGRGSVPIAVVLVILFSFSFSANRLLASFVVNDTDPRSVNSLTELGAVLLLYLLFCVSNWSITCLMEGEGRMKDIAIAIGYGMTPMIFCFNLATIVSQFVADGEQAFYWMILAIGVAYGLIMILMGIMTVQNFTLGKTLLTIVLTFLAMLIIIFLILLVADLINQVYSFFYSIYQELIFRT